MVFAEKPHPKQRQSDQEHQDYDLSNENKIKHRDDLEQEFGLTVRDNEGEAANHGIYYDDTEYDYMQHMRDLGAGTESHFVDASVPTKTKKGKMKLEDALQNLDIQSESGASSHASSVASTTHSMFGEDLLPSEFVRPRTYQDLQDVPDAIAGFQPDMDPRLREVLEALEDEAYVDDDEDIFEALAVDAQELQQDEWAHTQWDEQQGDDNDEGWESDRTVKAGDVNGAQDDAENEGGVPLPQNAPPDDLHGDGDWMEQFSKFKDDTKANKNTSAAQKRLELQSSVMTGASSLAGGRKKKRKGALTSTTGYSMSSSVLSRTEGQSILDARFDKIEEEYADDEAGDDATSLLSGMSGMTGASKASSQVPQLVRSDFDSIMGEFLQNHSQVGNKQRRVRVGQAKTGLDQLDEIRKGLGPVRMKTSSR
jgi:protein LTV1